VAYDHSYFPEWVHATLLPFDSAEVERHTRRLFGVLGTHRHRERGLQHFLQQLNRTAVASLAGRNPLLLTFLVQLSLAGVSLDGTRASLYDKIVDLWRRREDRPTSVTLGAYEAHQALDWIGWIVMALPGGSVGLSERELFKQLATTIMRELGLNRGQAQERAKQAIRFWENQGLLEHLVVGAEDAYTFVHASVGEFAAARYLADKPPTERWSLLQTSRRILDGEKCS
jgi:hypothetical protein